VRIYEPNIAPGSIHGANLSFIEQSIPHIWKLLVANLDELMQHSEVLVVMQQLKNDDAKSFQNLKSDQICIDFARALSPEAVGGQYRAMDYPSPVNTLTEAMVSGVSE
jgi:hypothetical protein